jgi:hypothetical protein
MLKQLFNKESKVVYAMEIVGIACLAGLVFTWWPSGKSLATQIAFYLFVGLYLFIRVFATVRWYKNAARFEGIESQFKKALVPTSYILALISGLLLIGAPAFILYIADFILLIITHVNVILIYFHIRDRETLPVNYFTHNKHLTDTSDDELSLL